MLIHKHALNSLVLPIYFGRWCWLPTQPSNIPTMVTPQLTSPHHVTGWSWLLTLPSNIPTMAIQQLTRPPASTHHTDIGAGSQNSHPNIVSKVDICQNLKASGITNVHLENGALQIQSTVKCHWKPQCLPPAKPLDTICTWYGTHKKCPQIWHSWLSGTNFVSTVRTKTEPKLMGHLQN